jgi:hypothetical protein
MKIRNLILQVSTLLLAAQSLPAKSPPKGEEASPLDRYIVEALSRNGPAQNSGSPGSLSNTPVASALRWWRVSSASSGSSA